MNGTRHITIIVKNPLFFQKKQIYSSKRFIFVTKLMENTMEWSQIANTDDLKYSIDSLTSEEVSELIKKSVNEKMLWKNATEQKRQRFRDRQMLYNNPNNAQDKIRVNMIRWLTNSLLALYYDDKPIVRRSSRNIYSYLEAENFNNVCDYDYDNMNMDQSDYITQKNRFFYWVGIEVIEWWDDDAKNPTYRIINPMSMYPDPNGHTSINNFQFIGFESMIWVSEIKDNPDFANTDMVEQWMSADMQINTQAMKYPRELSNGYAYTDWETTTIYTHYTQYKKKSYQVVLWGDKVPLSIKEIEPLNDKWCNVKYPVALYYYEPDPSDPWGINIFDIAEDKQRLKSLMMNLIRIQAVKQALGWKRFLDKAIYTKSKNILNTSTVWAQYIPVDIVWWSISDMIHKEPVDALSPDVYNFAWMIDRQAQEDTWMDAQTRWVASANVDTAREADILQMNTNINMILWTKINSWGAKTKRQVRYYFYKYYFSDTDEKFVELNRGISQEWDLFNRKDIISTTWMDPRLKIDRKWLLDKENAEVASKFLEYYPVYMADPTTPLVAKRFLKRKAMRLQWLSLREIEEWCPREPEELDAKEQIQLLNNNIPVQIWDMSEDHYTYLVIYQSALLTPATKSAIAMRKQAYIQSWQNMRMQEAQMQAMWNMQGMMSMWWNSIVAKWMNNQSKPSVPVNR